MDFLESEINNKYMQFFSENNINNRVELRNTQFNYCALFFIATYTTTLKEPKARVTLVWQPKTACLVKPAGRWTWIITI